MTQVSDWADQYRGELEKQSSARAAQIESLLTAGDYEAIHEWLQEWESEDKEPGSLRSRYHQHQHQLYGSVIDRITGKASTKSLSRSGADSLPSPPNELKDCFHHGRPNQT